MSATERITDHEFVNWYEPQESFCQFVYRPDNPLYHDPSGGFMMGGPAECGGSRERHES